MPSEISGLPGAEVHCTAHVIRIQEGDPGGLLGVGLRIDRYHAIAERRLS